MNTEENDCQRFVESLINLAKSQNHWTHGPDVHQRMRVGAVLADRYIPEGHPARKVLGSLLSKTDPIELPGVTGFKAELIAGGQGQEAYRHIAGAAAAVLEGFSMLVDLQNSEDRRQLHAAQDDVDKAERIAELADNEAGRQVGLALKQFLNEQITEEMLRRQLLDILGA
jgi:hypothetical protein